MPDIKHAISINGSPDRVYRLVSSGSGFSRWWAADVTEHESKRIVELGFFNRATIFRLTLDRAEPPIATEWHCETGGEWQDTKLLFRLQQMDGQTLLRFSHAGWRHETDYFVACNTTWGELMFRLKAVAEGKSSGPHFTMTGLSS